MVIDIPRAALAVRYLGSVGPAFRIAVRQDNVHLLQACNLIGERQRPCQAIVTDGTGARVRSWTKPEFAFPVQQRERGVRAMPGEAIILYAYGLGITRPAIPTGIVTPGELIPVSLPVVVRFEYLSETGWAPATDGAVEPEFAGLAPGSVGLYQVNVVVPRPSAGLRRCGPVNYNTVVRVSGVLSSDDALICVEPTQ